MPLVCSCLQGIKGELIDCLQLCQVTRRRYRIKHLAETDIAAERGLDAPSTKIAISPRRNPLLNFSKPKWCTTSRSVTLHRYIGFCWCGKSQTWFRVGSVSASVFVSAFASVFVSVAVSVSDSVAALPVVGDDGVSLQRIHQIKHVAIPVHSKILQTYTRTGLQMATTLRSTSLQPADVLCVCGHIGIRTATGHQRTTWGPECPEMA